MTSLSAPVGALRMAVVPAPRPPLNLEVAREFGLAKPGQPAHVKAWKRDNEEHFERGLKDLEARERGRGPAFLGALWAKVHHSDGDVDLGLISARVVTTAGVNYIVSAFQNLTELELMRFHGIGTGTAAEATTDTALAAEATTQYNTTSTRPQGTLGQGAAANTFETVATVTVKASIAVTEHGIFTQAAVPGGTLLDRSVFAVVNLASAEGVSFTYDLTLPAGS
jgi:hypothetical protein